MEFYQQARRRCVSSLCQTVGWSIIFAHRCKPAIDAILFLKKCNKQGDQFRTVLGKCFSFEPDEGKEDKIIHITDSFTQPSFSPP